jgi:hypothetical protein
MVAPEVSSPSSVSHVYVSARWLTVVSFLVSPRLLGNTEAKNKKFKPYPNNYNEQGL